MRKFCSKYKKKPVSATPIKNDNAIHDCVWIYLREGNQWMKWMHRWLLSEESIFNHDKQNGRNACCIMSLSQKSRNIKALTQSRLFIDPLPCNTLWETLLLLGFSLLSISKGQQTCTLVWFTNIWGRMPFLTPPWSVGKRTPDLLFRDPCSLHHGHGSLPQNTMLYWHRYWLRGFFYNI